MAYFGGGGQNGGSGRGGNGSAPQTLMTGQQLFVNPNQIQFQTSGNQNYSYSQGDSSQNQLQINAGGTSLLLQPPVNFVTDQLSGLGQLITQAAVTQNQQNLQNMMNLGSVLNPGLQQLNDQNSSSGQQSKQRVFTGTVTKIHDNFGFIDEEVFFQMGVVKGPILPKERDRVLVEADFNPSMPFKWNATRVQIVNMAGGMSSSTQQSSVGYGYSTSMSVQKPAQAPPPPSISGGRSGQAVSIISNPHSIYSSSQRTSLTDMTMTSRRAQPSDSSIMSTGVNMNEEHRGGGDMRNQRVNDIDPRIRDLPPRKDKERSNRDDNNGGGGGGRDSDRSRDRRRERSRSPVARRRDNKRESSPITKRRTSRDRGKGRSSERVPRDKSPNNNNKPTLERDRNNKRSRSRDTIKSSEGRSERGRSSVSPFSRRKLTISSGVKTARYAVQVPQFSLDSLEINSMEIKRRYPNLYTPTDFFLARASWMDAFPLHKPFVLGNSSIVHVFGRHVQRIDISDPEGLCERFKQVPNVLQAPDASCTFTVKVMILSTGPLGGILKKCGCTSEETTDDKVDKENNQLLPRLLEFAVGVKNGNHEVFSLGGNWSLSLDGPNPQSDSKVLVNTAIRCVKAQAGIDLTRVKTWYRFMELYYRRSNGNLETVIYFLPDTSPQTIPGQAEWDLIRSAYRVALYGKEVPKKALPAAVIASARLSKDGEKTADEKSPEISSKVGEEKAQDSSTVGESGGGGDEILSSEGGEGTGTNAEIVGPGEIKDPLDEILRMEVVDECNGDEVLEQESNVEESCKTDNSFDIYDGMILPLESEAGSEKKSKVVVDEETPMKVHPKSMTVAKLREELSHRDLSTKGLKQQLITRLVQALKDEEEALKANEKEEVKPAQEPVIKEEKDSEESEGTMIKLVDPSSILDTTFESESTEEKKPLMEDGELKEEQDGEFPLIKDGMTAEEKKVWERRYSVPKTPKLLVYPAVNSGTKKGEAFDCSLMSLSTLRDYRLTDRKEESFEVSLFTEFFYEMLQRDFAFKIYREIRKEYRKTPTSSDSSKDKEEDKEGSNEPSSKKRKNSTTTAAGGSGTPTSNESSKDAVAVVEKLKIADPLLLLAFNFFDQTKCGYIMEVDLEEICASVGIGITKKTLRKMVQKVMSKGSLHYRKLTDKLESEIKDVQPVCEDMELVKRISCGNKSLLPVFSFLGAEVIIEDLKLKGDMDSLESTEGAAAPITAIVDGQVVNVRQIKEQLEKAERERMAAEANVNVLKNSLHEAKNQVSELNKSNESLKERLSKTKETLKKVESSDKTTKDNLEVFKRASERYIDRVKDLIKLPSVSGTTSSSKSKKEDTLTASNVDDEGSSKCNNETSTIESSGK